jgi:hypothetical protein
VDLPNINIEAKPGKGDQLLSELAAQTEYWVTAEDAPERKMEATEPWKSHLS